MAAGPTYVADISNAQEVDDELRRVGEPRSAGRR
jgi:hypothetical protein